MPDFLKSEEQVINVGDVAIKKKTPSRTYIQMWVKLIEAGKMRVSKATYKQLKEYSKLLDEHPELVERIVKDRVVLIKMARKCGFSADSFLMYQWAFLESITIGTWAHERDVAEIRGHRLSYSESLYLSCDDFYINTDEIIKPITTAKEYGMKLQRKKNRRRWDDCTNRFPARPY